MTLTKWIASHVSQDTQERGRQYFRKGAVTIVEGDEQFVYATVQGGSLYDVTIERTKKAIKAWCTCPYCDDHFLPCKHIWATLLAAETKGYLLGSTGEAPRSLRVDELLEADDDDEDDWDNDSFDRDWGDRPRRKSSNRRFQPDVSNTTRQAARKSAPNKPGWRDSLNTLRAGMERDNLASRGEAWPAGRQIVYIVDVPATMSGQGLILDVSYRQRKKDGDWSKPKSQRIGMQQIAKLPDVEDRHILALLVGAKEHTDYYGYGYGGYYEFDSAPCRYRLSAPAQDVVLAPMCRTGRCLLRESADALLRPLAWDDGPPWEFRLEVVPDEAGKNYLVNGALRRGEERMALSKPALLVRGGLVFSDDQVARLQDFDAFDWVSLLRRSGPLSVPGKQKDDLVRELLKLPRLPRLDLPEELRYEEVAAIPKPRLKVLPPEKHGWGRERLRGELSFDYDGEIVGAQHAGRGFFQADRRRFVLRDPAAEAAAAALLNQLGFKAGYAYGHQLPPLELAPSNLPRVVRTLLGEGWNVEAEGKVYRRPGAFNIEVNSGIDWFELHGNVDFDGKTAGLPALLAALKRGDNAVKLDDGTFGILPEEWLKKYGLLAGLGKAQGDHLRFTRSQVGLLDALLAAQPEARVDTVFEQARNELRHFEGIAPADAPSGFVGELRGYQRDGLGWLHFLQNFAFGGCLADDMGLGKTVQVLALLESRRALRADASLSKENRPGPSLVVVPKSLVFNWQQEAARFTPQLRLLDHTGITRGKTAEHFGDFDVVLTTYGTLRRDALLFKDVVFDYCILDEAQAIKNASSESAKAARLLQGRHRLALSGTPIENHLGELWSLFEFLNPGMLGSASVFHLAGAGGRSPSEETRTLLARALRPFILRRTKRQVAQELPEKTEQTLYCELEPAQRKQYDELRDHYRLALLNKVEQDGINKSKMLILEALLRLRQAACHPGLIDKTRTAESSAKLDALLPQLGEVVEEGHKVLVFSQFTSLLAILRERLDRERIPYEYLDGRTRNRGEKVERFQSDPACKLFLISLKAGGLGLNLTAADYVFLLDPWWNPAVEAQAIDRAHRIGQTRQVFAYRLIARDTVEEKVLELQKTKRDLADAIINADNSLIRSLRREDLDLLLS
jgi:superfamily II DNA or RNA helicase